jgi:hypothetical protein
MPQMIYTCAKMKDIPSNGAGQATRNKGLATQSCKVEFGPTSGGIQRAKPTKRGFAAHRMAMPVIIEKSYVLTESALTTATKLALANASDASKTFCGFIVFPTFNLVVYRKRSTIEQASNNTMPLTAPRRPSLTRYKWPSIEQFEEALRIARKLNALKGRLAILLSGNSPDRRRP